MVAKLISRWAEDKQGNERFGIKGQGTWRCNRALRKAGGNKSGEGSSSLCNSHLFLRQESKKWPIELKESNTRMYIGGLTSHNARGITAAFSQRLFGEGNSRSTSRTTRTTRTAMDAKVLYIGGSTCSRSAENWPLALCERKQKGKNTNTEFQNDLGCLPLHIPSWSTRSFLFTLVFIHSGVSLL